MLRGLDLKHSYIFGAGTLFGVRSTLRAKSRRLQAWGSGFRVLGFIE